jgi:hypothetical protein
MYHPRTLSTNISLNSRLLSPCSRIRQEASALIPGLGYIGLGESSPCRF